jgi:hypothetical protein
VVDLVVTGGAVGPGPQRPEAGDHEQQDDARVEEDVADHPAEADEADGERPDDGSEVGARRRLGERHGLDLEQLGERLGIGVAERDEDEGEEQGDGRATEQDRVAQVVADGALPPDGQRAEDRADDAVLIELLADGRAGDLELGADTEHERTDQQEREEPEEVPEPGREHAAAEHESYLVM